jgi:hypothetical protein
MNFIGRRQGNGSGLDLWMPSLQSSLLVGSVNLIHRSSASPDAWETLSEIEPFFAPSTIARLQTLLAQLIQPIQNQLQAKLKIVQPIITAVYHPMAELIHIGILLTRNHRYKAGGDFGIV